MKRKTLIIIAVLLVALVATSAQAAVINVVGGIGADGPTVEQAWLSTVGTTVTRDSFEGLAPNSVDTGSGIPLAIGTLTGYGHVGSSSTYMNTFNEHATDGVNYWSNAAPNSGSLKGDFSIDFNTSMYSVGFYSIDFHDVGGEVNLTVNTLDGSSQTINLFSQGAIFGSPNAGTGVLPTGTEVFWVVQSDVGITSIDFHKSDGDGYAIDGIVTASTPIPAAIWLLGSGLVGLVGFRRTRS